MDKWQIDKVNDLYSQLDKLQAENRILKHNAQLTQFNKRLEAIEHKIDKMLKSPGSTTRATKTKK